MPLFARSHTIQLARTLLERKPNRLVTVAMANKTGRIVRAVLVRMRAIARQPQLS